MPIQDTVKGIKTTLQDNFFEQKQKCVVFVGSIFQPNLLFLWRDLVTKKHKIKFELLNQDEPNQNFSNHSWMSKKNIVWLGELTKLENIPQATKNHLAFFCSEQKLETISFALKNYDLLTIKLPKTINSQQWSEFLDIFCCQLSESRLNQLKNTVSKLETSIQPDKLIELGQYFQLFSNTTSIEKAESYSSKILPTEQKFFLLPDLLFSGNWLAFFKLWDHIKSDFPSPFWITFWINAFFKACFIKNNQENKTLLFSKSLIKAQNSSFFKKLSPEQLKSTLLKIYKIDHNFKTGTGSGELESVFFSLIK